MRLTVAYGSKTQRIIDAAPDLFSCVERALRIEKAMLKDLRESGEQESGASICACKENIAVYKAAIKKARPG